MLSKIQFSILNCCIVRAFCKLSNSVFRAAPGLARSVKYSSFTLNCITGLIQEGHTNRSCAIAKAEANPESISEDDIFFWSLIKEEDRPSVIYSDVMGDSSDSDENSDAA